MIPNLTGKTRAELLQLAELTETLKNKRKYNWLEFAFPEKGLYCRANYHKALEFFAAGLIYRFRMIGGGNGTGKSFNGCYELVLHALGEYPEWWEGKVQERPKLWWIVSESADTFKSSMQRLLLGDSLNEEDIGTGLIPKDRIVGYSAWSGAGGTVRAIEVRHKKGHIVTIEIKTFEQERAKLQGATVDGVLFDEEPPIDVYTECVFRLRGSPTKPPGISMLCFTPLKGPTEVVLKYLENCKYPEHGVHSKDPEKYVVRIYGDEVPHLSVEDRKMYDQESTEFDREARKTGAVPMGQGKIYPYPEDQVFVKPFAIPDYWPRCFTLDFGHHVTCVLWGAKDPSTGVLYIYAEYYCKGHRSAQVHALNIKERGAWIKGICDPSGGGRQDDGRMLVDLFRSQGLDITPGENAIISGIARVSNMFENGSLKIFDTCENTKQEYRLYRWDTKKPNEPARNQADHAMDDLKYKSSIFDYVATTEFDDDIGYTSTRSNRSFDPLTGY